MSAYNSDNLDAAAEALRASELRYRWLFESAASSADPILIYYPQKEAHGEH